ncbi:hypothetical protein JRQ81_011639 [Phrynocephalus forsythii]|uniref:Uncharacterized protein n=1 Tax=Phrynocephalus forsythii TaxID=171643 RepID=A0A9Q0X6K3_9SAUR|nr:hypothetical protein JRQ81_011639 [Phrynocephalus forsythii]
MNPSPDDEKHPSAMTNLLQYPAQPPPSMGYGLSPPYPPYYNQPAAGVNQGPSAHVPLAVVVTEPQPAYFPDFLCYSILTMIFCCFPFGLAALVFSLQTRQANLSGNYAAARKNSSLAQTLNQIALGLGILSTIVCIILMVLFFTSAFSVSLT